MKGLNLLIFTAHACLIESDHEAPVARRSIHVSPDNPPFDMETTDNN